MWKSLETKHINASYRKRNMRHETCNDSSTLKSKKKTKTIDHRYRSKGTSTRHCWIVAECMSNGNMRGQ